MHSVDPYEHAAKKEALGRSHKWLATRATSLDLFCEPIRAACLSIGGNVTQRNDQSIDLAVVLKFMYLPVNQLHFKSARRGRPRNVITTMDETSALRESVE